MTPTRLSSIRASLVRCNDLSWLTFKKLNRQFHARLQESRREAEDGVGDLHLLEGVRAHEGARVPSLKRNSMLYRSSSTSSRRSCGRKCGSHMRPLLTLLSLALTTPPSLAAPALHSTSKTL